MSYIVNEGRFELDYIEDRSLNILSLPHQSNGTPLNLVISRDVLLPGEDLTACLARQIKQLTRTVKAFKELKREGGWIGAGDETSFPAIVIYTRFEQGRQPFFQAQCIAQGPDNKLLILTLTNSIAFDDALIARWKAILAGFIPTPAQPAI